MSHEPVPTAEQTSRTLSPAGGDLSQPVELPGHEFPIAIYASIIGAFAWMLFVAWVAFSAADGTDLDLLIATVLGIVFFGIPIAMHHTSLRSTSDAAASMRQFMDSAFDTFTGPMPARQAWLEVALIPVALAIAATLFGIVYLAAR
jgi:hypothetical protein